jgi:hypothetical protein
MPQPSPRCLALATSLERIGFIASISFCFDVKWLPAQNTGAFPAAFAQGGVEERANIEANPIVKLVLAQPVV